MQQQLDVDQIILCHIAKGINQNQLYKYILFYNDICFKSKASDDQQIGFKIMVNITKTCPCNKQRFFEL